MKWHNRFKSKKKMFFLENVSWEVYIGCLMFIYDDTYILIFLALKVQNEMHKNVNIL